ncbi:hypothetical protein DENSPDRAFT_315465 [Dentipellis sp. KUC8613]|nr:hypothetical protein DENSPDRAFT_315465 [Dentipellis sp. KUC8613]
MLARVAIVAPRRLAAAAVAARTYTSSVKEGSVAASREFGKKEKAVEDQYARRHEQEQIAKLRAEIAKKKAELVRLTCDLTMAGLHILNASAFCRSTSRRRSRTARRRRLKCLPPLRSRVCHPGRIACSNGHVSPDMCICFASGIVFRAFCLPLAPEIYIILHY